MEQVIDPDQADRLAKLFMDTGEARSYEDALRILQMKRLAIVVGPQVAHSPMLQASLLTAVNTGRRCFLGGVEVVGCLDVPLLLPWPWHHTLAAAVTHLQGRCVEKTTPEIPRILIGNVPKQEQVGPFCVRAVCDGWRGGVLPNYEHQSLPISLEFLPSGVLSGAIAVSEAFQHVRGGNPYAGRRAFGISLWEPEKSNTWLDCQAGPALQILPAKAWLIGLGHLGQAYLWTLGFLPFAQPGDVDLVLQDIDKLSKANDSTSPLTDLSMVGTKKTRAMANWCDMKGYQSRIVEREFNGNFHIADDEPHVALCGVDNPEARSVLEDVGFDRIFEAGLGSGASDFLCFQTHMFPASQQARGIWGNQKGITETHEPISLPPAYQTDGKSEAEACGLTQLAGRSVGSSFVGTVASTLVIAELLRMVMGGTQYETIDGDLRTGTIRGIPNQEQLPTYNPGLTAVKRQD